MAATDQLPRLLLASLAVLLVAWFAVLFYDQRTGASAAKRLFDGPGSSADWRDALGKLEDAQFLSPGTKWSTIRAGYLLRRDKQAALNLANRVVRAEPDNYAAWLVVMVASRGRDHRRWAQAIHEMERLNPPPHR